MKCVQIQSNSQPAKSQKGLEMFYKKESMEDYKRSQRKIDFEKFGSMLAVFLAYRFDGIALAGVVGLVFVIYSASEIQKLLNYQNFMKEKDIGLHSNSGE